jgi:hypothetical protein
MIKAGQSTTLTWKSTNATSCAATGREASDGWAGAKATSGSLSVNESFAPATSSAVLTFTLTCRLTASGLSANSSAKLTELQSSSASGSHYGGTIDWLSEIFLFGLLGLHHIACRAERERDAANTNTTRTMSIARGSRLSSSAAENELSSRHPAGSASSRAARRVRRTSRFSDHSRATPVVRRASR